MYLVKAATIFVRLVIQVITLSEILIPFVPAKTIWKKAEERKEGPIKVSK